MTSAGIKAKRNKCSALQGVVRMFKQRNEKYTYNGWFHYTVLFLNAFLKAELIRNRWKRMKIGIFLHPVLKVLHDRCGQLLSFPSHTKHNTYTCLTHLDSIAWNNNNTRRVLWLGHWSQLLQVTVYFWGRLSGNTSCELLLCMYTRKRAFIKTRGCYEGIRQAKRCHGVFGSHKNAHWPWDISPQSV